ncbi:MAG: DUF3563 domain-containing protein [Betaproteobacteria bacterium]|nr:DUF3563 domain-containing protein [Betaproteobacteria bacterium]
MSSGDASDESRVSSWFARVLRPLLESTWEQEVREREAYLAQATDMADLEARLRASDGALYFRARTLR